VVHMSLLILGEQKKTSDPEHNPKKKNAVKIV